MTCIVGIAEDGNVWIGGDSSGVGPAYDLSHRTDKKVFLNGEFIIGFTSSFRMGQLLAHAFVPPMRRPAIDIYAYMVTDFVNEVRICLKAGGFAERHNEAEQAGTFLVGYAGRLFGIHGDYQVSEQIDGFDAVGCGSQIAKGSLYASKGSPPDERIRTALEAAEHFSAGVRAPFNIIAANDNVPVSAAA